MERAKKKTIVCNFTINKKTVNVNLKSQRPSKFKIEETVMVPNVDTLDNLYKVRHEFSSTILRADYKSYYTEHDLDIFKRYRNKA